MMYQGSASLNGLLAIPNQTMRFFSRSQAPQTWVNLKTGQQQDEDTRERPVVSLSLMVQVLFCLRSHLWEPYPWSYDGYLLEI